VEFSLELAGQLRESLSAIDFKESIADDLLTSSYLNHYQLDQLQPPFPFRHSIGCFDSLSYRLVCQYFAVPDEHRQGTVVVVHGYYDHVGLFRHVIEFCLARGLSVLTFDLPGHGLSSGDPASIDSFDYYSQALVDCLQVARNSSVAGPWHVLAQSTGAAAVINCLLCRGRFQLSGLDKIVLLAPLLRPIGWKSGLLKFHLMRWFVKQTKRDFATNSHDEEFLRFILARDPLQTRYLKVDWVRSLKSYLEMFEQASSSDAALHIVQGTEDTTVDWRHNLPALTTKFPAARTHIIDGARHHLVNESIEYRKKIFTVVAEIMAAS